MAAEVSAEARASIDAILRRLQSLPGWTGWLIENRDQLIPKLVIFLPRETDDKPFKALGSMALPVETHRLAAMAIPPPAAGEAFVGQGLVPGAPIKARGRIGDGHDGSIGAFCMTEEGVVWLITANHVLSGNTRHAFTGKSDHGVWVSGETTPISRTVIYEPIGSNDDNVGDIAACLLSERPEPVRWPGDWTVLPDPVPVQREDKVFLISRGQALPAVVEVPCFDVLRVRMTNAEMPGVLGGPPLEEVRFRDMILVRGDGVEFVRGGGSGGLVLKQMGGNVLAPVGLLTGTPIPQAGIESDNRLAVVTPLKPALEALGLPSKILV